MRKATLVYGSAPSVGSRVRQEENDEGLDIEIARQVFGLSREAIDAWPWGAPFFSSDRTAAADVVGRMLTGPDRQAFEQELEQAARHWGWGSTPDHAGTATLLLVLTPDEICRAALKALQQSGRAEPTRANLLNQS